MNLSSVLQDPELGYTPFTVKRTSYRRWNGESVPTEQMISAAGCIHPGTPEMLQLLPEEERKETFIAVYTDFSLSAGENSGGVNYTAPDRILWNEETWRVIRVRYWAMFGVNQCIAVRVRDG